MDANKDAKYILDNLFTFSPKSFVELKNINILVIGAGSFPSFCPLIHALSSTCPQVNKINFTLIEPDQAATNRFKDTVHNSSNKFNLLVHFSIHNQDIKSYLENTHDSFDLIYFEHPDVSILNALLEKTRLISNSLTISMQESIPYLRKIIKNQSVIIGSFIFKGDLCETKSLLKFSLNINKMHIIRQRKVFFDGHYYSLGLIGVVDPSQLPNKTPKKLANDIRFSTNSFGVFILASLIILLATPNKLITVSFFFVIAQLFYNRYGIRGLIVRFLLIIGQIIVLM